MKTAMDAGIRVDSSIGATGTRMSVDAAAMQHIIGILTEMYSDPILAIVREYATNAWDSHREASHDRPIQVTVPTTLSPNYVVEDFGVGMSRDGLENIFAKYGASTKRMTNDQVGCLGLGCKSALAYAEQFVLCSRKDALEYEVLIARTQDGGAEMTIVHERATDERDGVCVTIPVRHGDAEKFAERAATFFSYWPPGHVILDGADPDYVFEREDVTAIDDDTILIPSGEAAHDRYGAPIAADGLSGHVVMGNVAYPVDPEHVPVELVDRVKRRFVTKVGIGEVDIAPSREALRYTPRTIARFEELAKHIDAELQNAIQSEVTNAKTAADALKALARVVDDLSDTARKSYSGKFTWRGKPIPTSIEFPKDAKGTLVGKDGTLSRGYYGGPKGIVNEIKRTLVITSYTNTTFGTGQRRKTLAFVRAKRTDSPLAQFLADSSSYGSSSTITILTTDQKWTSAWFPKEQIIAWQTILDWKPPQSAAQTAQTTPSWSNAGKMRYTETTGNLLEFELGRDPYDSGDEIADRIDRARRDGLEVVRFRGAVETSEYLGRGDRNRRIDALNAIAKFSGRLGVVAYHVPDNRVAKFDRRFKAPDAYDRVKELAKAHWKQASLKERRKVVMANACPNAAASLNGNTKKVKDAKLREYLRIAQTPVNGALQIAAKYAKGTFTYDYAPLDHYPLLSAQERPSEDHVLTYVNAAHAAHITTTSKEDQS